MAFLRRHVKAIAVFVLLFIGGSLVIRTISKPADLLTGVVDRGRVEDAVTVSGIARAAEAARLGFAEPGVIHDILVKKGARVERGDILATLDTATIDAERQAAVAALSRALADRDETILGPRDEVRDVASIAVRNAREDLARVRSEEAEKVAAARRTLLSSDLEAIPDDLSTNDIAPVVGGSYTCEWEGTYTINVYPSKARSGYSYRYSGLETGTESAYTDAAGPLGACGLTLRFDADSNYAREDWTITIPNIRSDSYTTNLNALSLALERERAAVAAAEDALDAAIANAALDTASPRAEELRARNAAVEEALARVAEIDARRERRIIRAPFTGTISDTPLDRGEVAASSDGVVVMVSDRAFEVVARIPEVDVTKVLDGSAAALVFDAKDDETIRGRTAFISPLATSIDGVAYFDATIELETVPSWMREGLNADVRLIAAEKEDAVRVPRRFLTLNEGRFSASVIADDEVTTTEVRTGIIGSNGYVEVELPVGTTLVSPESAP